MVTPAEEFLRIATVGAAYSANKGAGSMVQAIIDACPDAQIDVHSTYPRADQVALAHYENATVVGAPPKKQALLDFPLALIAGACRKARLPWRWTCRTDVLRSFAQADVVADVTGISFSDSRPKVFLPYHFLLDVIPLLVGVPVVKCSQAIGPFDSLPNRVLARLILPRLAAVVARGPATGALLDSFGVEHVEAHDLAFAMELRESHRALASQHLDGVDAPFVVVAPSTLVMQKCEEAGIDYVQLMSDVVGTVASTAAVSVVLLAHSSQPSLPSDAESIPDRLNDLVVCRHVNERLGERADVHFIDADLAPPVLRAVIERAETAVTSRFHAMVSALAVGTPPVVIGWSHKYGEVLDAFGITDNVIDYEAVHAQGIADRTLAQLDSADTTARSIRATLSDVVSSAQTSIEMVREAASR